MNRPYSRSAQIFRKPSSHVKILGARRMTWSRYHKEELQVFGATVKKKKIQSLWGPVVRDLYISAQESGRAGRSVCFNDIVSRYEKSCLCRGYLYQLKLLCQFRAFLHTKYQIKFGPLNIAVYCFCLQRF